MQTASKSTIDTETEAPYWTAVAEVWPGEFELRIETGENTPTTTVHTLDATQLRALRDRAEGALRDAE